MKVLYAIQGTGNGHLSRAIALLPKLQEKMNVDVLISGNQADLKFPYEVKYRLHGLSFIFGKNGNIDYLGTFKSMNLLKILKDIYNIDVAQYDLVLNDFEPITAWACKLKGVKCFSLSHQCALFSKNVPRPKYKDWAFEFILKYYAPANHKIGFHFKKYDSDIFFPIIRNEIRNASVEFLDHCTVYLPAYSDEKIIKVLSKIKEVNWHVFSKHSVNNYQIENVFIHKISIQEFEKSLFSCAGVICGAGFETPAEALFLNKKLLVIPMVGQYEQQCNAESLKALGVTVLKKLNSKKIEEIQSWLLFSKAIKMHFPNENEIIVNTVLQKYAALENIETHHLENIII